jgi:hypothetical protein
VWVIVKRVCEALGIADQSQAAAKLKEKAWATTTLIVAVAPAAPLTLWGR